MFFCVCFKEKAVKLKHNKKKITVVFEISKLNGTEIVMKKKSKLKSKYHKQPIWRGFAGLLRIFFKRPDIVNLAGKLPDKAIYVANHSAMAGPVIYNLYFPKAVSPWGAYPMLEGYKSRYKYLKNVYFIQKRGMNKFFASIHAFFEAFFSIWIYKGMKVIPSYPDGRMLKTIRRSVETLDNNRSVIIFPENSSEGYKDVLTSFSAGFVMLAERYGKLRNEEIPIYPVYYNKDKSKMVIGKPVTLSELKEQGFTDRKQIAGEMCRHVNDLYYNYVQSSTADEKNDIAELEPLEN